MQILMLCQRNNGVVLGDELIACSFFPEVMEFRLPANTRDQL